jgi:hypothetical protein
MAALDKDALLQKMLVAVLEVAQADGPKLTDCLKDSLDLIADLARDVEALYGQGKLTPEQKVFFEKAIQTHKENAVDTCDYQLAALAKKAMDAAMAVLWTALKAAVPW